MNFSSERVCDENKNKINKKFKQQKAELPQVGIVAINMRYMVEK